MAYRKRSYKKKRPATRKRYGRKMKMTRGVPRVTQFRTKLKHYMETWSYTAASVAGFWKYYTFSPSMLGSQFSDFSAVFDEYRIAGVALELRPNFDSVDISDPSINLGNITLGSLHYAIDPSSQVVPAGVLSSTTMNLFLEQSQNVKTRSLAAVTKLYYKPKVASQVQGGGLTGKATFCPWLKCAYSDSTNFTGVHLFIQPNNFDTTKCFVKYDIFVTCYMQFRGNA